MNKITRIIFSCTFLVLLQTAQAQQSINSSGKDAQGTGGNISYSVGQVVYTTAVSASGSVAQGVQQPQISIITSTTKGDAIQVNCTSYPNPASTHLIIVADYQKLENPMFQLYDLSGNLLEKNQLNKQETLIDISNLQESMYIIKITDNGKEVKTLKVTKIQ